MTWRRRELLAASIWPALAGAGPAFPAPAPRQALDDLEDRIPQARVGAYLVVVDGRPLWGRAADLPRAPASLAKMMTALACIDAPDWQAQRAVPVSRAAARIERHRVGLRAGEQAEAGALVAALLIASANDAAQALAEAFADGEAGLVAAMNARAAALGLHATRFANASGLDAAGQQSSAADLWRLGRAVVERPLLADLVARADGELRTASGRRIPYRASNRLLGRVDGVVGIKTGATARAGHCLCALARRGAHEVALVLLDAPDRWQAASDLIELAFAAGTRAPVAR